MSKQLALAAAFSVFTMSAFALLGSHATSSSEPAFEISSELAAPTLAVELPYIQ